MRLAGLVALALLQSSCATYSRHGIRPLRPLELATAPYQEAVTASLTGTMMYESGCLLFRDDQTRAVLLPLWPTGSIFNGTAVIFHRPGSADQPLFVGEEFVMEGRPVQWVALAASNYAPFAHQCGARPFLVSRVRPAN